MLTSALSLALSLTHSVVAVEVVGFRFFVFFVFVLFFVARFSRREGRGTSYPRNAVLKRSGFASVDRA